MGIKSIKPIDLEVTISGLLDDYAQDVRDSVADAVIAGGKQAVKIVRKKSPKDTGAYKKGWKLDVKRSGIHKDQVKVTVYNATRGHLTHLLEKGHQKVNGGRVEGIPHIRPAVEESQEIIAQLVTQAIEEAGDK